MILLLIFLLGGSILGLFLIFRSRRILLLLIPFYLGWRKEIYFMTDFDWAKEIRDYTGGAALGIGMILSAIPWNGRDIALLNYFLFYAACGIAFTLSTFGYRIIPQKPRWVREFEQEHSILEILYVKERGAVLMERYPKIFPQFISSQEGWEAWLLTLIPKQSH